MKQQIKSINSTPIGRFLLFFPLFLYHRFYCLKNRIISGYFYSYYYYYTSRIYRYNDLTIGIKELGRKKTRFPHPIGIVIGKFVRIGKSCTIYQNVTIGTKNIEEASLKKYPIIGDNVVIGANAVIIGNVIIGNNVIIGANSLVNKNVDDNSIVYGNPMKVKKRF